MTETAAKIRLALAIYEPPVDLDATLAGLAQHAIGPERLSLTALGEAAGRLRSGSGPRRPATSAIAPLIEALVPLQMIGQRTVLASPTLLRHWQLGIRIPALWGHTAATQSAPRLAETLERAVERGAVVLIASPLEAAQQWPCTRVLLGQSSCPVLSLEHTLPFDRDKLC